MKKLIPIILALMPIASYAENSSGAYIGGTLGYVTSEDKGVGYNQGDSTPNGWTHKASPDGGAIALLGGYNWKLNDIVLVGIEADYEFRNGSERDYQKFDGATDTDFAFKSEISDAASIRARLGYAASEKATIYFTAGYATAKVKRTFYDYFPGFAGSESHSKWQDGWTAGLGMDYAFSKNVSARVEYRYADYGNERVNANLWHDTYKQELTEQGLRVGAIYSF